MEFNLIRMRPTNGYVTIIDRKNKPRLMCFKDIKSANKCKHQLATFRANKGHWPDLDLSSPYTTIHTRGVNKLRDTKDILDFLEVDTVYMEDITKIIQYNNVSILYCHNFESKLNGNSLSLEFSAQEIDMEVDNFAYIRELNYNYYKSD